MSQIPSAVLSERLKEQVAGRKLIAAVLTTYQFDAGFFEQQVLPVFLDIPLSHAVPIRLHQLEQMLTTVRAGISVYYDADGLMASSDYGAPRLDFRRIPIWNLQWNKRDGVFHPKTVFLLVEDPEPDEEGNHTQYLIIAALSANLTQSGWWSNVEVCHIEEIEEGTATRIKGDVEWFLRWLRDHTPAETDKKPVQSILSFLGGTEERAQRTSDGFLHPHFYTSRETLSDFLARTAGDKISGTNLEIISPYFDDRDICEPLQELIDRFQPREVRVFLPRSAAEAGLVKAELYDAVRKLPNTSWGRFPKKLFRLGKSEDAGDRFVHAKVYRFFTQSPKREVYLIGSANLTSPAHRSGGNMEAGFLVEVVPDQRPDFWLVSDTQKPRVFEPKAEQVDEYGAQQGTRLQLRYHWDTGVAEAFWSDKNRSPKLKLEARSLLLGEIGALKPESWLSLPDEISMKIGETLPESSYVTVHGDGPKPAILLVQEEGMAHKPSILLTLSVADILRYWSLLTPEQRTAFIEERAPELALTGSGAELMVSIKRKYEENTLFDRFAGFFHAFACLERTVRESLEDGNEQDAEYRLFGCKYDSLGTLLKRLTKEDSGHDDVERYVLFLCAKQLCRDMEKEYPDFWRGHRDEGNDLKELLSQYEGIRNGLIEKDRKQMPGFLDWFDTWFLRRATIKGEAL
jgi:hypothetical protein